MVYNLPLQFSLFVVKGDLLGAVLWIRPPTKVPRHNRCGAIEIPPCSKAVGFEHMTVFYSPSPQGRH